jgi:hypothetical protein
MAPKKEKKTFILENASGKAIGTYIGTTPGVAAKKAATAGVTNIILRETGVHDRVRHYNGSVKKLTTPKTVMIAGKPVKIAKESHAKFVKVVHHNKKGKKE